MLDEHEWSLMEPALNQSILDVQRYRAEHAVSLADAKDQTLGATALRLYRDLTGFPETNHNAIWHHRVSLYGPPCVACGKPLRTPRATLCAACGMRV